MNRHFLDFRKTKLDQNGIWTTKLDLGDDVKLSKTAWEDIYDYDLSKLNESNKEFKKNKLAYHLEYIKENYSFNRNTVYLEIGSGPGYIGQFLTRTYGCHFVGIDFNYKILLTLKKYLENHELRNFTLIHADITHMPIKANSIDYLYGGGVIEHMSNTEQILRECHRVLRTGGVAFNTVPAFNLWWITRFYNNIPASPLLKTIFEFIHTFIFRGKILKKFYGYELSFTTPMLESLHTRSSFSKVKIGAFAFFPSSNKLPNYWLRKLYYFLSKNILTCPVYYAKAIK